MNWNQIPRIPQRDGYGQGLLDLCAARPDVVVPVSYTHLTLPTTPYV